MDREPVYDFFKGASAPDLPVVKAIRKVEDYTFKAWTPAQIRRHDRRNRVRRWVRSHWWPARIRDLEAQIRTLEDWD